MSFLTEEIEKADIIAIGGHVRPDGDCIGSCMGLYRYITENYKGKSVSVYLEEIPAAFAYLNCEGAWERQENYDLFISLDCGSPDRLGEAEKVFDGAAVRVNVDHHISNTMFAGHNHVEPEASSTCEVLCGLLDMEKISVLAAQAFYTGIIHDTGVFKHSNTSLRTMETAGRLMEKGISFGKIIDESFYLKTYRQLQIMDGAFWKVFV